MHSSRAIRALALPAAIALAGPMSFWSMQAAVQPPPRPPAQTYHWMLPAQQQGVDVARLHAGDCYVVDKADGIVYFGDPPPGVMELQGQLRESVAHLVEEPGEHVECSRETCLRDGTLSAAITRALVETADRALLFRADHRPNALDSDTGGAYTDVGSAQRTPYRNGQEQRMIIQHLTTSARANCYEAPAPLLLSVHIRDFHVHEHRTGFYSGYLYIEHHHPPLPGDAIVEREPGRSLERGFVGLLDPLHLH